MSLRQVLKFASIYLLSAALVACGGGGGGGGGGGSPLIPAPVISAQPASISVYDTQDASFSVLATDTSPISYQWKKNGVDIVGETNNSYTLKSVALTDNGALITVAVSGNGGTTLSTVATLNVISRTPKITTHPSPQSVTSGQFLNLSVAATGLPSLSYQWLKNGRIITGATAQSYAVPVTFSDNSSNYSVVVTNSLGSITSNPAKVTVNVSTLSDLIISEVSTCYYSNIDCWVEIYNPTNATKNLANYTVKSYGLPSSGGTPTITSFSLPAVNISSGEYLIVSGNNNNLIQRGTQNIRVKSGTSFPYWNSSGFIELLNTGVTVDFISFGTVTQTPTTAGMWTGSPFASLPSSALDYGKSIVRPYPRTADTNTRSSADWIVVDWATPAGRNDIPSGTKDEDGDGIPDSAEEKGGTYAGLDLYAMGVRTGQKDILIELDSMESTDPGINPRIESLRMVVNAFSIKGINVVFDAGNAFGADFSVANFNLGQGSHVVPYEPCVTLDQTTCNLNLSNKRSVYDWKEENMDLRRRSIFHYMLMGSTQFANGNGNGGSGIAELPGNDFITTLGNSGFNTSTQSGLNLVINTQAATIMHELGHNLGLRHGGDENLNYKPNYWSVMNYLYQLPGLDPDPSSMTAYQRWRLKNGDKSPTLCSLVASPCGSSTQFKINYSDGTSGALNEASLYENLNIGRGSNSGAYADWNMNGQINTTPIAKDLTGENAQTILTDYNDWANLYFPFTRNISYGSFGAGLNQKIQSIINPISSDRQEYIVETSNIRDFIK